MVLTKEDVAAIETVEHYIHDEDQCYLMLYGALAPQSLRSPPLWSLHRVRHTNGSRRACIHPFQRSSSRRRP